MGKTDIYDYLAKIYLDNSNKRHIKKDHVSFSAASKVFLKIGVAFASIALFVAFSIIYAQNKSIVSKEVVIMLGEEVSRIGLENFNLHKKEITKFDLAGTNLARYNTLVFSARKSNFQDKLLVRVELTDELGKKAQVLINQLPTFKWQDFKIKLNDFKGGYDKAKIASLAFVVDDWKTKENRGALYIDNVSFSR